MDGEVNSLKELYVQISEFIGHSTAYILFLSQKATETVRLGVFLLSWKKDISPFQAYFLAVQSLVPKYTAGGEIETLSVNCFA